MADVEDHENRRRGGETGECEDEDPPGHENAARLAVRESRAEGPEEFRHHPPVLPRPDREREARPARLREVRVEAARGLEGLAREIRLPFLQLPPAEDRRREGEVRDPPDLDPLRVLQDLVDLRPRRDRVPLLLRGEPREPLAPDLPAEGQLVRLTRSDERLRDRRRRGEESGQGDPSRERRTAEASLPAAAPRLDPGGNAIASSQPRLAGGGAGGRPAGGAARRAKRS